jgi:site-specific recombinase XerD
VDTLPHPNANAKRLKVVVPVKGGDEMVVRLSRRAWRAIRAYLHVRKPLDQASGLKPHQLPVFAQHSRLAEVRRKRSFGKISLRRWEPSGAEAMLRAANKVLFDEPHRPGQRGRVTPHSLGHYFITKVWRNTHDLRMAQKLARHRSITSTQRYAHADDPALDEMYDDLFGETSAI